jgi:hypothetical protein
MVCFVMFLFVVVISLSCLNERHPFGAISFEFHLKCSHQLLIQLERRQCEWDPNPQTEICYLYPPSP